MSTLRPAMVSALVDAALLGMEEVADSTADEVLSAALTLGLRTVQVVLTLHPDRRESIREAVSVLLMACTDQKVH